MLRRLERKCSWYVESVFWVKFANKVETGYTSRLDNDKRFLMRIDEFD